MQAGSRKTAKRKRMLEDVQLRDGPRGNPSEFHKTSGKEIKMFLDSSLDETNLIYPTILPSISKSSPWNSNLCPSCTKIDLDTLLSRPHKTCAGQLVKKLRPVQDWKIDSCHLCSLFHSTVVAILPELSVPTPLKTFSSNRMEDRTWRSMNTNMLGVRRERYIVSQPEGIAGPIKLIKEKIDNFDIVKTWIDFCQSRHTKICAIEKKFSVSGLRLIDCDTRTIVLGEGHPYVALSYVWGTPEDTNRSLENLPATIEDAITVTMRVGYRFIWIDRYCIDQKNYEETADQIGKMDLIYQNAELTIIAAVGEDPSYGLPGVDERKREPEHLTACTRIGKHFLITVDAWPKRATVNSKWATRAWTYQEALLSRRRLVFSKEQMYFECYGMHCCESLKFPLESLHRKDMQGFKSEFCSENRVGLFPKGVGTAPIEIVRRIEEYSELNLSNASDILKGMLGIFSAFQRSRLNIHHCAGIPILPSMPERSHGKPIKDWTLSMGFFTGLLWSRETRSKRRHGFPSWSWAGWYGPVKWDGLNWPSIKVDSGVDVKIQLVDGRILTLETFKELNSHSNLHTQLSNVIHITAWIIEVTILESGRRWGYGGYKARLELEDGGYLKWLFNSTSKIEFPPGEVWKGIILGRDFGTAGTAFTGPAILVCRKIGDNMERVGLDWVSPGAYDRYNKDGVCESDEDSHGILLHPLKEKPVDLVKSWGEVKLW